jgi:dCTP deaminase
LLRGDAKQKQCSCDGGAVPQGLHIDELGGGISAIEDGRRYGILVDSRNYFSREEGSMILTGPEIKRQVSIGHIAIEPFSEDQVNPNSYNYRLGPRLMTIGEDGVPTGPPLDLTLGPTTLLPGHAYLGHTAEAIGSSYYVTMLNGRSSVGRLGMFLNFSADLGQLGPAHQWTLEIMVVQPLIIYAKMKVGQATFWAPQGERIEYRGEYARRNEPTPNLEMYSER